MTRSMGCLLAVVVGCVAFQPVQAARCVADTVSSGGFESVTSAKFTGITLGMREATVEVRHGSNVVATGEAANGDFDFELPSLAPEALLELRARGKAANGEEFIELASYVGTVQQLVDEAGSSGYAGIGTIPTLALTPESTARYVLLRDALAGGAPVHECDLAARTAALDLNAVRERTAVIKLMIEQGGSSVPVRKTTTPVTTLDTVASPTRLADEITAIEQARPGAITALVTVLSENFCNYFANGNEVLLTLGDAAFRLNSFSDHVFESLDATTGRHADRFGTDSYTFTCSADRYEAVFAGNRVSTGYSVKIVNGQPRQVQQDYRVVRMRLSRLDSGLGNVALGVYSETRVNYPFEPTLPDETQTGSSNLDLVRQRSAAPFAAADLEGGEFLMPTRVEIVANRDLEYERLSFAAGGTGQALDVGGTFTWQINAGGELLLDFPTRDARILPLRAEPGGMATLAVIDLADGSRRANHGWVVKRDPVAVWPASAALPATYMQHAGRVFINEDFGTFRFDFQADREAKNINTTTVEEFANPSLFWSRPDNQTIVLRRCSGNGGNGVIVDKVVIDRAPNVGECTNRYRERRWTMFRRAAAPGGDYLWVLEDNRDWYSPTDPAVTGVDQPPFSFYRAIFYQQRPLPVAKNWVEAAAGNPTSAPSSLVHPSIPFH